MSWRITQTSHPEPFCHCLRLSPFPNHSRPRRQYHARPRPPHRQSRRRDAHHPFQPFQRGRRTPHFRLQLRRRYLRRTAHNGAPAGKLRFVDFKTPKAFVGIGGVIESVPNPDPEAKPGAPREVNYADVVLRVKSSGSLQHRSASGASLTMGYSFGAAGRIGVKTAAKSARYVTSSSWVVSPEF